jgi:hypothetical protein
MDPAIPRNIRQLDFSGDSDQLAHFLGAFDSSPPSNASSVRLQIQIPPWDDSEPVRGDFTRFLSSSFPKLSILNVGGLLPKPSSAILTTSNLTSLKLFLAYGWKGRYTLAQFSQILQRHPNLQELDLNHEAIPLPDASGTPVRFTLPRLVDLRLHGTKGAILGFIDLIGMSSPLHNVIIHFGFVPDFTPPVLASTMEKILKAYYDCQGLDYPRKVDSLAVSLHLTELCFDCRSRSAPTSNLKLQFGTIDDLGLARDKVVEEILAPFPSGDVQEFAVDGLPITRRMLQRMKVLSHLRLCNRDRLETIQALGALSLGNRGASTKSTIRVLNHVHTYR